MRGRDLVNSAMHRVPREVYEGIVVLRSLPPAWLVAIALWAIVLAVALLGVQSDGVWTVTPSPHD